MIRFLGNIEAKTDAKGRVFIPAGFRRQLQSASEERLVLRKDVFQDCLVLYPESVWFKTQNQLRRRLLTQYSTICFLAVLICYNPQFKLYKYSVSPKIFRTIHKT